MIAPSLPKPEGSIYLLTDFFLGALADLSTVFSLFFLFACVYVWVCIGMGACVYIDTWMYEYTCTCV